MAASRLAGVSDKFVSWPVSEELKGGSCPSPVIEEIGLSGRVIQIAQSVSQIVAPPVRTWKRTCGSNWPTFSTNVSGADCWARARRSDAVGVAIGVVVTWVSEPVGVTAAGSPMFEVWGDYGSVAVALDAGAPEGRAVARIATMAIARAAGASQPDVRIRSLPIGRHLGAFGRRTTARPNGMR